MEFLGIFFVFGAAKILSY